MHLEQLKYFEAAARLGSFAKAATAYSISHQGLGKSIANLEKEIGAALFIRNSQGVSLTPEGKALLKIVKRFLSDYASFSSTLPNAPLRCVVEGIIPLYVTPRIMDIYLFPLLQDFKSRYENADIAVFSLDYDEMRGIIQGEPEGVFLASFLKEDVTPFRQRLQESFPDIADILWIQEHVLLCGHKDLLQSFGGAASDTDLAGLEICTDSYLKDFKAGPASARVRYETSSYSLKLNLLLSKQCLTYVNRKEFETHYAHYGDLDIMPPAEAIEVQTLCFYRQRAEVSTAKNALLNLLKTTPHQIY